VLWIIIVSVTSIGYARYGGNAIRKEKSYRNARLKAAWWPHVAWGS